MTRFLVKTTDCWIAWISQEAVNFLTKSFENPLSKMWLPKSKPKKSKNRLNLPLNTNKPLKPSQKNDNLPRWSIKSNLMILSHPKSTPKKNTISNLNKKNNIENSKILFLRINSKNLMKSKRWLIKIQMRTNLRRITCKKR